MDREQAGAESYTLTVLAADDAVRSREGTTQVSKDLLLIRFYPSSHQYHHFSLLELIMLCNCLRQSLRVPAGAQWLAEWT